MKVSKLFIQPALSVLGLLSMAQGAQAADSWCSVVPDRILLFSSGYLQVYATNGDGFSQGTKSIRICNVMDTDDKKANLCKEWHRMLTASQLAKRSVTIKVRELPTGGDGECRVLPEKTSVISYISND